MGNSTIDMLMAHRSIRKYADRKVTDDERKTIIECAQMAPTTNHVQAYSIIDVVSPESRKTLAAVAGGQAWVESAPLALLFCADLHRGAKYFDGMSDADFDTTEQFIVATVDAALAAEKAFIAAQALGMGGVCVGGIRNDVAKVMEVCGLPELVYPLFLLCLGFPAEDPGLKPRLSPEAVCKKDIYDESCDDRLIAEYNERIRQYYIDRTGGEENDTWTAHTGAALLKNPRYKVSDDLRGKGFLKR